MPPAEASSEELVIDTSPSFEDVSLGQSAPSSAPPSPPRKDPAALVQSAVDGSRDSQETTRGRGEVSAAPEGGEAVAPAPSRDVPGPAAGASHSPHSHRASESMSSTTSGASAASASTSPASTSPAAQAIVPPSPIRSSVSTLHATSTTLVSGVLVVQALEHIAASKEARKNKALSSAVEAALGALRAPVDNLNAIDPILVFEPLRLACETRATPLMVTALDCINKLVSYDFFSKVDDLPAFADALTDTVCECFSPSPTASGPATTPHDTLLLRILATLLSLILSSRLPVHQSALLKAVRTVYNIFLLGRPGVVQTVAQATLGQLVGGIFSRVASLEAEAEPERSEGDSEQGPAAPASDTETSEDHSLETGEDHSLETGEDHSLETGESEDTTITGGSLESDETRATTDTNGTSLRSAPVPLSTREQEDLLFDSPSDTPLSLYIKDAFLIFRAFCKLSMKPLGVESETDAHSHALRSKLLSLQLILTILTNHMSLFVDPHVVIHSSTTNERTAFVSAIKQYLCLTLSRNAVSPATQVFELSCEIFWRLISGLRHKFKKEIQVLLTEIFLPILEMRTSSLRQKSLLLGVFHRIARDPQILVDIYLNYDCDRASLENIYERLVNTLSRLETTHFPGTHERVPIVASVPALPFPVQSDGHGSRHASNASVGSASVSFDGSGSRVEGNGARMSATFSPGAASGAGAFPAVSAPTPASTATSTAPGTATEPIDIHIKRQSLLCLNAILHSLVLWASRAAPLDGSDLALSRTSLAASRTSLAGVNGGAHGVSDGTNGMLSTAEYDTDAHPPPSPDPGYAGTGVATTGGPGDDPTRFENAKLRKTTLLEGIRTFNFKPKRGIVFLIENGFIADRAPRTIAHFLLHADGLNKAQIGEYLGEGDAENIAIMHAFVDMMNFSHTPFVSALRLFLQSFRLPGEAQKIDRFMLKFAERYTACNAGAFANADTAYVLAFSVILLNTDAHNPQVKKPMTRVEFVKNNRGIDDGRDLDEALLTGIYDDITQNEIRMKDEAGPGAPLALVTVGRDLQREAYVYESVGMVTKTESLFRSLVRERRRAPDAAPAPADGFFSASHYEHVRPMFEVVWMPILAGISAPLQDSEDLDFIAASLDSFRSAVKIVCVFDLALERDAFITTLAKFTFLNNLGEMRPKNVEAVRTLLDIALANGNNLKGSWKDVLTCVSQLERFQLITQGIDSQELPQIGRKVSNRKTPSKPNRPTDEVANETRSRQITVTADRIFASTPNLSGTAIVDFVQALSDVSWEEIQSSGLAEQPRVFCLQKLVEICYYNMERIRLEWSAMWAILGAHFNQVTCHTNPKVSFLALDSLRQLAMRFLEKEELANFKFQKDFLKPFEYAMTHNPHADARDMVLQCLQQMIQARVQNLRSGWRTMFSVFSAAAKVHNERIALQAFEIVQRVNKEHFARIVRYGSFADLTVCIGDFCKISKYQRVSLQAIEMLRSVIPLMLDCEECPVERGRVSRHLSQSEAAAQVSPTSESGGLLTQSPTDASFPADATASAAADDPMLRFWFPVLFGFYDIIMNGEDLEVRKRALDYLFATLKEYGDTFSPEFWDTVCKEVLFPIFAVLRSRTDVSRFTTHEDMSVWLSTTMIQALRDLVSLFTFYFDVLERLLDRLLDLLVECVCQENDTLARIGTACLQQLLQKNVRRLSPERWAKFVSTFVALFEMTTATQLFDPALSAPEAVFDIADVAVGDGDEDATAARERAAAAMTPAERTQAATAQRRRTFKQIIVKCVLQLLLIETTGEVLQDPAVYRTIPHAELMRLMGALRNSYAFAHKFNADKDLRVALWKVGFMRDLPNLLRQESTSAATLVNVLLRMYKGARGQPAEAAEQDNAAEPGSTAEQNEAGSTGLNSPVEKEETNEQSRKDILELFAPLGLDILVNFVSLNSETQVRNITAWNPVCCEILEGFNGFDDDEFIHYLPQLYPVAVDLLKRDNDELLREHVHNIFVRVGTTALKI